MSEKLKRNLLLGLAVAAAIAGVIVLVAPGGHGRGSANGRASLSSLPSDVQLAAEYLAVSRGELRRRLRAGESLAEVAHDTRAKSAPGLISYILERRRAELANSGRSAASQREALARARSDVVTEINRSRGQRTTALGTAAAYLGVDETRLRERLRQGRSLAEVAAALGKDRSGLIEALAEVKTKRLQVALANGAITATEEKTALAGLHSRVLATVERHRTGPSG